MPDLDQGGTFRETTRLYQGPSLGWVQAASPPTSTLTITSAGTTVVQPGTTYVHVSVNGAVTVQLYAAKGAAVGAGAIPGSWVQPVLTVNDSGGFAQAFPITIMPAAGETIGGASQVTIAANYGLFVLLGDVQNGGWTVASGVSGTALTDAPNDGSAYGRQSAAWAKVALIASPTISSPTFTGVPVAPTAAANTNTTQIATTAFVIGQAYAPLASPTFTGVPAAPTPATADNTTKLATTAFVKANIVVPGQLTASLGADVLLNNTANYFDGPSVAQGTTGTWFVSGAVTVVDTGAAGTIHAKLWDGTTVIASGFVTTGGAGFGAVIALSGYLASPAANLRISARDVSTGNGKIVFNLTGNSKDSTISAYRIA